MVSSVKCRKCRGLLMHSESLSNFEAPLCLSQECHLWYVAWEGSDAPAWLVDALSEASYQRGKLTCPHCGGRLGSFDFMHVDTCVCGEHELPPVRLVCSRVDVQMLRSSHQPMIRIRRHATPRMMSSGVVGRHDATCDNTEPEHSNSDTIDNAAVSYSSAMNNEQPNDFGSQLALVAEASNCEPPDCKFTSTEHLSTVVKVGAADESLSRSPVPRRVSWHGHVKRSGSRFSPLLEDRDTCTDEIEPSAEHVEAESDLLTLGVRQSSLGGVDVDAFTCPICLEVYYLPFTCHPCQHVFCGPCLRRLRGTVPISTRCPLCREVICSCMPNQELTSRLQSEFPEVYQSRKLAEKKAGVKLPPLPSTKHTLPLSQLRRARSRGNNRNLLLANMAGVCFVALLAILGASILVTTVTMVLWYLWEVLLGVTIDTMLHVNHFFDTAWTTMVTFLLEGHVTAQEAKILLGSFGQVLYAFGRLYNETQNKIEELKKSSFIAGMSRTMEKASAAEPVSMNLDHYIPKYIQADIANYLLIMTVFTYLIYRLARYCHGRQVGAHEERLAQAAQ